MGTLVPGHVFYSVYMGLILFDDRVGDSDAMGSPATGTHGLLWPRGRRHWGRDP